jgi:uncharacterized protein (DUF362 family)
MLNRRNFLKKTMVAYVAAKTVTTPNVFAENRKSNVAISQSSNHRATVRSAVAMLGGMENFISKGDVVAVKPNMAWAREPKYAANTNPEVVAEVVKLCFEAGAKKVYVTDNPCNNARSVYAISRIPEYVQKEGAEVFIPQNRHYKEMNLRGTFIDDWPVLELFKTADKVINVPVAKHHGSTQLTASIKNWLGAVGGFRGSLHQNLHQAIVDLATFFKPTLNIVDCTRILMANGPTGGSLDDVKISNKIIASTDQVATDFLAAKELGFEPTTIKFLQIAEKQGLGTSDKNEMNIVYEKV